uniref:Homing endonuclease I-ApeII n=2 Tax=Thermoproteati TaxID=1783275 RepID=Q4LEH7_9ARCH|nr:Homing endonuclease I-ApeII [uncultured Candidatus Nitrosocaldus sp.]BAL60311.1 homing endonuclease I-ApeII [uncultured crenarchaeote]
MVLIEHSDIIDPRLLPAKGKYLRYYLLGIADSEGSFSISIKLQPDTKFGVVIDPIFKVTQHKNNRVVLELFKRTLNCGRIIEKSGQPDILEFVVDNRRHLKEKIIPFFKRYKPIIKRNEFALFTQVLDALEAGKHRDARSLKELVVMLYEHSGERVYPLEMILKEIDEREEV